MKSVNKGPVDRLMVFHNQIRYPSTSTNRMATTSSQSNPPMSVHYSRMNVPNSCQNYAVNNQQVSPSTSQQSSNFVTYNIDVKNCQQAKPNHNYNYNNGYNNHPSSLSPPSVSSDHTSNGSPQNESSQYDYIPNGLMHNGSPNYSYNHHGPMCIPTMRLHSKWIWLYKSITTRLYYS
ncbi:CLUMA_CG008906, isoform A [Clunio marinus]|uniref:CLUMA_CG008906, isoform A n=1 Tax=Clunio marinus TaxID=568069 RepID=A0A1J1I603_9DIPT|nr:CLUMA_CG008906, isoform A [Clunio marinus]